MVHAGWLLDVMDVVDLLCWGEGVENQAVARVGRCSQVVVTGLHVVVRCCGDIVKRSC